MTSRNYKLPFALLMPIIAAPLASCAQDQPLPARARSVLSQALAHETAFVKVHAAEALIALGEKDEPRRVFRAELPAANESRPYRIGVWRVLAASAATPAERAEWIARTEAVVLDASAPDRLHAIESLGKLGHAPRGRARAAAEEMARGSDAAAAFPLWVLHLAGDRSALPAISAALDSSDPVARLRAAYVLHQLKIADPSILAALDRTAERELPDTVGYTIILCAAVALDANPAQTPARVAALERVLGHGAAGARYHASQTLMHRYSTADFPKLSPLLDHTEGDARIGAAWAILHVTNRAPSSAPPPQGAKSR